MGDDAESQWRVKTEPGGGWVSWRPAYALPRHWRSTLDGEHLPYLVELELVARNGAPECRAMRLIARDGGEPISASRVRRIRLGEYIEVAITAAAMRFEERPGEIAITLGGRHGEVLTERGDVDVTARAQFASQAAMRHEHGTDEHLREVARVYEAAAEKPTRAVEDAFGPHISRSTAARWVMQARHRGFLPQTTRGRASAKKESK